MGKWEKELAIEPGVTAIIGSGGKTTLLYLLAEELSQKGSVIVTTSTHIFPPTHLPVVQRLCEPRALVCVGSPTEQGKLTAPEQSFEELAQLADYVLVEADGSKGLPLKAHAPHEPVIPKNARQVICVVGASGLGQPVERSVHRAERFTELTGCRTATARAVAQLLHTEALHSRVLINQAEENRSGAGELAALLSCPVTLAALKRGEILCSY